MNSPLNWNVLNPNEVYAAQSAARLLFLVPETVKLSRHGAFLRRHPFQVHGLGLYFVPVQLRFAWIRFSFRSKK